MLNLVTLGAVYIYIYIDNFYRKWNLSTQLHISISLLNKKQGLEEALFVVASKIYNVISKVSSNEEEEYVTLENSCEKNKCLKRRVLKERLCF